MTDAPAKHWAGSRRLIVLTVVVALVAGVPAGQFGQRIGRDLGGEPGGLLGMALPMLVVGIIAGAIIYYLAARRLRGRRRGLAPVRGLGDGQAAQAGPEAGPPG